MRLLDPVRLSLHSSCQNFLQFFNQDWNLKGSCSLFRCIHPMINADCFLMDSGYLINRWWRHYVELKACWQSRKNFYERKSFIESKSKIKILSLRHAFKLIYYWFEICCRTSSIAILWTNAAIGNGKKMLRLPETTCTLWALTIAHLLRCKVLHIKGKFEVLNILVEKVLI